VVKVDLALELLHLPDKPAGVESIVEIMDWNRR
jgi:hypothetical protein